MLKTKRITAFVMAFVMVITMFALVSTAQAATVDTPEAQADAAAEVSSVSKITSASDFSWDNASVYFLLTDRFYNGNTSNDHSYNRSLNQSGQPTYGKSNAAAFHGGDFAGITKKIQEGYFDDLGVNALWISAPYEQIHGYCNAGSGKDGSYPHYSYHGYYALDFSQTDANFGTAEEFETMVDTAHEHGIRIVLDVVMNHVGYSTLYDMNEYGYGVLKSGWETPYYNCTLINTTYGNYVDYNSNSTAWAKWWGSSWIRAGIAGYSEDSSSDLTKSQSYLPDVRTESTATVDIPEILKTKWTKEGTLASKQAELNSYFATGKSKTVRNYLVYWLSQWVEQYGVDGFRCDTAKHVELASWKALKDQCKTSLETWRKNNPTKPGADWDEDFWMTGECYTHYLSYDSYYTQGGFDSMINFSFNDNNSFDASASGVPGVSSINSTYANYASQLNSNDNYNVLSYLSSHDTRLARNCDLIYQGSAFQLLPGGIQIFYGDETKRGLVSSSISIEDHGLRSDMNWSSIDQSVLSHWQKVGTFRNNHVAVGAGSHTTLSATSGAAFARTYSKNGVTDKIVACIGANKNTSTTITLNSTFADGTVLKNTYDGTTATVSGGKVTFNSGANGTILLEDASTSVVDPTQPSTTAPTTEPEPTQPVTQPTEKTEALLGDVNLDGKINIIDCAYIQLADAKLLTLTDSQKKVADVNKDGNISILDAAYVQYYIADLKMSGAYVGEKITVEVPVTQPSTTEPVTQAPTQPATQPSSQEYTEPTYSYGGTIKFTDNQNWGTAYAYFWADNVENMAGEWPGTPMNNIGDNGYGNTNYEIEIPSGAQYVIFNNGNGEGTNQTQTITLVGEEGYWTDGSTDGGGNLVAYPFGSGGGDNPGGGGDTPTPTPSGSTIKFTDNQNWGTAYAYFWADGIENMAGAWPGTPMNNIGDNGYGSTNYEIDIPEGAQYVIFNNGNGEGTNQTQTINLVGEEGYWTDGSTDGGGNLVAYPFSYSGGSTGGETGGGETGGGSGGSSGTIKFTDSLSWGTVYAYFFSDSATDIGGAWPGTQMTWFENNFEGKGNYQIAIPDGATYVVFTKGQNGPQTVDLPLSGVEGYWLDGSQTDGKYNGTAWDPSAM